MRTYGVLAFGLLAVAVVGGTRSQASDHAPGKAVIADSQMGAVESIARYLDLRRSEARQHLSVTGAMHEPAGYRRNYSNEPLISTDQLYPFSAELAVNPREYSLAVQTNQYVWHVDLMKHIHAEQTVVFDSGSYRLHQQFFDRGTVRMQQPIECELDVVEHQCMINDFRLWPAYLSNGFLPVLSNLDDAISIDGDYFRKHAKIVENADDRVEIGRITVDGLEALAETTDGQISLIICSDQVRKLALVVNIQNGQVSSWTSDFEGVPGLHETGEFSMKESAPTGIAPSELIASLPAAGTVYRLQSSNSIAAKPQIGGLKFVLLIAVFCILAIRSGHLSMPRTTQLRLATCGAAMIILLCGIQYAAASCTQAYCETSYHFGFRTALTCYLPVNGRQFTMPVMVSWGARGGNSTLKYKGGTTTVMGMGQNNYTGNICTSFNPGPCEFVVNTPPVSGGPYASYINSCVP